MTVLGMSHTINAKGETTTTLHVSDEFSQFHADIKAGRSCVGKRVETIYAGTYNCTALKVGMEIEVMYDKAITTAKGVFQPVKHIDILSK